MLVPPMSVTFTPHLLPRSVRIVSLPSVGWTIASGDGGGGDGGAGDHAGARIDGAVT